MIVFMQHIEVVVTDSVRHCYPSNALTVKKKSKAILAKSTKCHKTLPIFVKLIHEAKDCGALFVLLLGPIP